MISFHFERTEKYFSKCDLTALYQEKQEEICACVKGALPYADSLGWHHVENWANQQALCTVQEKANEIRKNSCVFVLVGIGGSNQAARAAIRAIHTEENIQIVYAGNTLSAFELAKIPKFLEGKDFYINVIAKNFKTLEPGASFRFLRKLLQEKYGDNAHKRIIATGTKGSEFEQLALQHGYDFFTFPHNIGGRYSVFSDVGLLPMAVAGLNINALVAGAKTMEKRLTGDFSIENPAIQYALIRALCYQKGYRMEMLSFFEPRFRYFAKWWTQLFAESEGKDNLGCYPIVGEYSEDLHSVGQFVQEGSPIIFETFLQVSKKDTCFFAPPDNVSDQMDYLNDKDFWEINKAAESGTISAHAHRLPCLQLDIPTIDEEHLGMLFYFYMFMCTISSRLLGINPFDQNGVEAYKESMFKILKQ